VIWHPVLVHCLYLLNHVGLAQRGPGAPGVPTGGVRPPLPPHLHSQTEGTSRPGQPRSHMPGMDNHVVAQGSKDDRSEVNIAVQEVADAPKKVCGPILLS
jgi:hypothetical protein